MRLISTTNLNYNIQSMHHTSTANLNYNKWHDELERHNAKLKSVNSDMFNFGYIDRKRILLSEEHSDTETRIKTAKKHINNLCETLHFEKEF
jgi:hypothetical protein